MDLVQDVHDPLQGDDSNHSNSESENEFEPDSPPSLLVLVILILIMWLGLEEGIELVLGGEEPGAGVGEEVIPTLGHGWKEIIESYICQ
jgi:hypothetical protein